MKEYSHESAAACRASAGAFLAELAAVVLAAEPGCLVCRVHRSTTDPLQFLFYETYVDAAAFELHRKAPHQAAFRERREKEGLTDGPVVVETYRPTTA